MGNGLDISGKKPAERPSISEKSLFTKVKQGEGSAWSSPQSSGGNSEGFRCQLKADLLFEKVSQKRKGTKDSI